MLSKFFAVTQTSQLAPMSLWKIQINERDFLVEKLASTKSTKTTVGTAYRGRDLILTLHAGIQVMTKGNLRQAYVGNDKAERELRDRERIDFSFPNYAGQTEAIWGLYFDRASYGPTLWDHSAGVDKGWSQPWMHITDDRDMSNLNPETPQVLKALLDDSPPGLVVRTEVQKSVPLMCLDVNQRGLIQRLYRNNSIEQTAEEVGVTINYAGDMIAHILTLLEIPLTLEASTKDNIATAYWKMVDAGLLFLPEEGHKTAAGFTIYNSSRGFAVTNKVGECVVDLSRQRGELGEQIHFTSASVLLEWLNRGGFLSDHFGEMCPVGWQKIA